MSRCGPSTPVCARPAAAHFHQERIGLDMAREGIPVFDADAHVAEPLDLWQEYLPEEFRERAPVIEDRFAFGVTVEGQEISTYAKRKGHLTPEQRGAEAEARHGTPR